MREIGPPRSTPIVTPTVAGQQRAAPAKQLAIQRLCVVLAVHSEPLGTGVLSRLVPLRPVSVHVEEWGWRLLQTHWNVGKSGVIVESASSDYIVPAVAVRTCSTNCWDYVPGYYLYWSGLICRCSTGGPRNAHLAPILQSHFFGELVEMQCI